MDRQMDANPAGLDTKIMRNRGKIHLKRTKIDRLMNRLVILVSCLSPAGGWEDTEEGRERSSMTEPWLSFFQASVSSLCKMCSLILQTGLGPKTLLRIRLRKKKVFIK